jgi:hypothetical protein
MAEPFALDDPPTADAGEQDTLDGKIQCPECDKTFKPTGLQRHITMIHRGGVGDTDKNKGGKRTPIIETRWADFQRGCALLVSLACVQCANALSEDAEKDAIALASYCQNKPKFKKQVEDFLTTADFLLLVGAFGGTAQRMISHHSVAKRIPGISPTAPNPEHATHDPASRMMEFMGSLPPEQRHMMMDRAMEASRQAREQQEAFVQQQQEPEAANNNAPGAEPVVEAPLTEHDKQIRDAMNSGTEFMETVGSLG